MDTKALIREAHARFDHNSAKTILKNKYQAKLTIAHNGGLWKITPELITFLDITESTEIIILDSYENPVKVNRAELLYHVRDTYNQVMEEWLTEFTALRHKR